MFEYIVKNFLYKYLFIYIEREMDNVLKNDKINLIMNITY